MSAGTIASDEWFLATNDWHAVIGYDPVTGTARLRVEVLNHSEYAAPVRATANGMSAIVVGDFRGQLVVLSPEREPRWPRSVGDNAFVSPIVAALDGMSAILVNAGSTISCLDHAGELRWQADQPDAALSWALVREMLVVASRRLVFAIDVEGGTIHWERRMTDRPSTDTSGQWTTPRCGPPHQTGCIRP